MLDDPSITKVYFDKVGEQIEIEVDKGEVARLACIIRKPSGFLEVGTQGLHHVEVIDCTGGIYTIECKTGNDPKKIWFETKLRKSFLPPNPKTHIKGRYD